jgi:hypothetical protein
MISTFLIASRMAVAKRCGTLSLQRIYSWSALTSGKRTPGAMMGSLWNVSQKTIITTPVLRRLIGTETDLKLKRFASISLSVSAKRTETPTEVMT